ncbi:hypothetical protein CL644_00195 [bacterium]|nr:hypothetical protein [Parcubacteria group bacterium]MBF05119.1 hypothetical protein [bacterium]|tara:strand:+ start:10390 stop:10794 length:405 start_codon:yes stop_codon:yes gene_type:complete
MRTVLFLIIVGIFLSISKVSADDFEWLETTDDYWVNEIGCSVSRNPISSRWEFGYEQTWILREIDSGRFQYGDEASFQEFLSQCGTFSVIQELQQDWEKENQTPPTNSPQHEKRPERYVPAFFFFNVLKSIQRL